MLAWAEEGTLVPSSPFAAARHLPTKEQAEQLLKKPLISFRDQTSYSNIPNLKVHLQEAFEKDLQSRFKRKKEQDEEDGNISACKRTKTGLS